MKEQEGHWGYCWCRWVERTVWCEDNNCCTGTNTADAVIHPGIALGPTLLSCFFSAPFSRMVLNVNRLFDTAFIPVTMETRCFHKELEFQRYQPKDFCTARYEAPSYRVAKSLFSETKNQDQKSINAKICFVSLIGHVGTRAIFSKSTAADKKSWKGTWEVTSRTPVECMLCCTFAQARRCNACSSCHKGPAGP